MSPRLIATEYPRRSRGAAKAARLDAIRLLNDPAKGARGPGGGAAPEATGRRESEETRQRPENRAARRTEETTEIAVRGTASARRAPAAARRARSTSTTRRSRRRTSRTTSSTTASARRRRGHLTAPRYGRPVPTVSRRVYKERHGPEAEGAHAEADGGRDGGDCSVIEARVLSVAVNSWHDAVGMRTSAPRKPQGA